MQRDETLSVQENRSLGGRRRLIILGIRGLPAAHGGFETFAERLAPWMLENGWDVTVYCQGSETGQRFEDRWNGIHRIHIPVRRDGPIGTVEFDIAATRDALALPGVILTLGYNTGFLCVWLRLHGRTNIVNMDGLEWKRAKYSLGAKIYLFINERLAAHAAQRLIADHPAIGDHLATRVDRRKITMIPYGSNAIETADPTLLEPLGLEPRKFLTLIARPEPENSVLEIVEAFSRKPRGVKLVILGNYDRSRPFEAKVLDAAGDEVVRPGAIYDHAIVASLRYHSIAYIHGHRVGGTNPSLVEALGAGNAIIAHDNPFNRWVAGDAALFFSDADQCAEAIETILADPVRLSTMRSAARARWADGLTWPQVLRQYQDVLNSFPVESTTSSPETAGATRAL
jgi:glycosyltransferase involved in cell wall biosynthesis